MKRRIPSRRLSLESLENRQLFAGDIDFLIVQTPIGEMGPVVTPESKASQHQLTSANPQFALDVDGSGDVDVRDFEAVVNFLNGQTQISPNPVEYLDVNEDGLVSAIDALLIANYLNQQPPASSADDFNPIDEANDLESVVIRRPYAEIDGVVTPVVHVFAHLITSADGLELINVQPALKNAATIVEVSESVKRDGEEASDFADDMILADSPAAVG